MFKIDSSLVGAGWDEDVSGFIAGCADEKEAGV